MSIIAVLACSPMLFTVWLRWMIGRNWRKAAKALDGRIMKPGITDGFVCRAFVVEGSRKNHDVVMKTVDRRHLPASDGNASILGWLWNSLSPERSTYAFQITVRPTSGLIPPGLGVTPKVREAGRVDQRQWKTQMIVKDDSYRLLESPRRRAVQEAALVHGVTITSGALFQFTPGPLFSVTQTLDIVDAMIGAAKVVTMSTSRWAAETTDYQVPGSIPERKLQDVARLARIRLRRVRSDSSPG